MISRLLFFGLIVALAGAVPYLRVTSSHTATASATTPAPTPAPPPLERICDPLRASRRCAYSHSTYMLGTDIASETCRKHCFHRNEDGCCYFSLGVCVFGTGTVTPPKHTSVSENDHAGSCYMGHTSAPTIPAPVTSEPLLSTCIECEGALIKPYGASPEDSITPATSKETESTNVGSTVVGECGISTMVDVTGYGSGATVFTHPDFGLGEYDHRYFFREGGPDVVAGETGFKISVVDSDREVTSVKIKFAGVSEDTVIGGFELTYSDKEIVKDVDFQLRSQSTLRKIKHEKSDFGVKSAAMPFEASQGEGELKLTNLDLKGGLRSIKEIRFHILEKCPSPWRASFSVELGLRRCVECAALTSGECAAGSDFCTWDSAECIQSCEHYSRHACPSPRCDTVGRTCAVVTPAPPTTPVPGAVLVTRKECHERCRGTETLRRCRRWVSQCLNRCNKSHWKDKQPECLARCERDCEPSCVNECKTVEEWVPTAAPTPAP